MQLTLYAPLFVVFVFKLKTAYGVPFSDSSSDEGSSDPGTARAGATIIGGMLFGLSRRAATEFSFFLAVPTLIAAGAYDLDVNRALLSAADFDRKTVV